MKFLNLKPIKITQRNVDIWSMGSIWISNFIYVLYSLFILHNYFYAACTFVGVLGGTALFVVYNKGHESLTRVIFLTFITLLAATIEQDLTYLSRVLYIVPLLGMLLLGRVGFLASSLFLYFAFLVKSGFTEPYTNPTDISGYFISFIGFVIIISLRLDTERIFAQEAQQESERQKEKIIEEEAKLRASISSFPRGYILTDLNGNIIITNKLIQTIFDLQNKPNTLADIQKQLGSTFDIVSTHSEIIRKKESAIIDEVIYGSKFLRILLNPIYIVHGEIIGGVILVEDITEEKVLARSKDEFFSIASHELRTPLTAIRGNTSMIKDYYKEFLKDKELSQMIEDIHDSSIRLIHIVNDFLTTSSLEQGKIIFKRENVDLKELVNVTVKEVKEMAAAKQLHLDINAPEGPLPLVNIDKDRVKEVLINLIANAIKFTEKGGIIVRLSEEKKGLKVSVEDTGSGIPAQNQGLLFRKFQQASDSILTRDTTRSTGLGLYISKLIIENLGGEIYLERSEEGKGTTFTFTLPFNANLSEDRSINKN